MTTPLGVLTADGLPGPIRHTVNDCDVVVLVLAHLFDG
jgi:hypothetical protein